VRLFTNSLAGRIHDSFHSPWPFVIALIVGATATAMYGLLWGFWVFLMARLLWGLCWSFLRLEGYATVITEAPTEHRGRLMGVYQSIVSSGQMVGGFLGGVLTDTIGYRNCLLSFAALILFAAFALLLEQWRSQKSQQLEAVEDWNLTDTQESLTIAATQALPNERYSHRFQAPKRWMLYFIGFINILLGSMIASTLGRLLKVRFGLTISFWQTSIGVASATGALMFIRWLFFFFLAPTLGHLSDRVGRQITMIWGLAIGILALFCLATQEHILLIILAVVASSVSGTAISISLDASVADVATEPRRGQFISRYVTFTDLGSASGPLVSYLLLSVQIGLEWVYLGGLALLIVACTLYGLSLLYPHTSSRSQT
jgi:MFS family permease